MFETDNFTLSIEDGIYKSDGSANGIPFRLGINGFYTTSVSNLLEPDGTAESDNTDFDGVTFGDVLFGNSAESGNLAYVGAPTVTDAVPYVMGVVVRSPAVIGAYPAQGETVKEYQKFNIQKNGFMLYRTFEDASGTAIDFGATGVQVNDLLVADATDGHTYFVAAGTTIDESTVYTIGKIVQLLPDDETAVVKLTFLD